MRDGTEEILTIQACMHYKHAAMITQSVFILGRGAPIVLHVSVQIGVCTGNTAKSVQNTSTTDNQHTGHKFQLQW